MKIWDKRKQVLLPLFILTLLNLVWASTLDLYSDEAYYVLFSHKIAWGYFDHPPMVAWLIKAGSLFFGGELGVRFSFVLLLTFSFFIVYRLVKPKHTILFWFVAFSLFPFHLIGFMALPDVPLIFFSVVFFWTYSKYLQENTLINILVLSISAAGMLYSKYHGGLILLFTVVSNLGLFKKPDYYLIILLVSLLMIPHVIWLIDNNFISISYHLFDRESKGFNWVHVGSYLVGFFLFNGPLLFFPLYFLSHKQKLNDLFKRALRYNLKGFFVFFLVMSFRGQIEPNWTSVIVFPTLILGFPYISNRVGYSLASISMGIILLFRVYLIYPFDGKSRAYEFHGHERFAKEVKNQSGGIQIVANRYQEASLLSFYLNDTIPALNIDSRKNQFDLWGNDLKDGQAIMYLERTADGPINHPYFGNYALRRMNYQSSSSTSSMSITKP